MFGIKKFLNKDRTFDSLTEIRVSPVGYFCNHLCPMCWRMNLSQQSKVNYMKNESDRLTLKEYLKLLEELPSSVKHIDIVGGGEPLLYPEINGLIRAIKHKKIDGRLITNGSLLNLKIINSLITSAWNTVRISFHSATPDVYKKINGVEDYYRVQENIKLLIKKRGRHKYPQISLLFVIQRDNARDIINFAKFAEELGVDEIEYDHLITTVASMKQLLPTQKQKRHIIFDLLKIEKKINIQNNIHQTVKMLFSHPKWGNIEKQKNYYRNKYCYLSQINVDIGSNGTVSPCCLASDFIQYGNIRNKTIQELWKDSAKIRKNMAEGKFYKFCYEYCNYGSIIKPMPLYLRWDLLKRQLFKRLRH